MHRRTFLTTGSGLGMGVVAGCTSVVPNQSKNPPPNGEPTQSGERTQTQSQAQGGEPPLVENRPEAVYIPTHFEGMQMPGMATQGDYTCALTYSFPHRFWLVTGDRRKKVTIQRGDVMHLMPIIWDQKTKIVTPDANPSVNICKDGKQITQLAPWPMLSQPMGFHFGDNVQLPSEGTYQVEVNVGQPSTKRTGSLADGKYGPATFSFEAEFSPPKMQEIMVKDIPPAKEGKRGALKPMGMEKLPTPQVPKPDALPGKVRGKRKSGDATFVVTTLSDASRFGSGNDQTYLAVSPRTPYNRYMLPLMSLSGTLKRNEDTIYDDILQPTLDSELNYHYGATVNDVRGGDELTISVDAPPQTARHEGYEMAFFKMPELQITL